MQLEAIKAGQLHQIVHVYPEHNLKKEGRVFLVSVL